MFEREEKPLRVDTPPMSGQGAMPVNPKLDAVQTLLSGGAASVEIGGETSESSTPVSPEQADTVETSSRQNIQSGQNIQNIQDGQAAPLQHNLEPYLNKLGELNLPATKEAAKLMQELLAQNPGLTQDEAAFLASNNKLTENKNLMKTALSLLSGGVKTDAMLLSLMDFLSRQDVIHNESVGKFVLSSDIQVQNASESLSQTMTSQNLGEANKTAVGSPMSVTASNTAPLTDLLTMIIKGGADSIGQQNQAAEGLNQGSQALAAGEKTFLAAGKAADEIMQNNSAKLEQMTMTMGQKDAQAPVQNANTAGASAGAVGADVAVSAGASGVPGGEGSVNAAASSIGLSGASSDVMQVSPEAQISQGAQAVPLGSELTAVLSELPEFRGTPADVLEKFSNMLLRVAGETANPLRGEMEKPELLLDKLFTRIDAGDTDAGAKLKAAREELFARLSIIEEAMTRAAPDARANMLDGVQKLMEHVRVLNSIETFAYMQLPIMFGEERKSADLYIFKRKGSRKPDPENVNILLAIDLEHMGHWESLVNIKNNDLSLSMEVAGEREKEHFSENTVLLHEMLAQAGFKLVNTDISFADKETTPLSAMSTLSRYQAGKSGKVDFLF
jgi:hypothetical protein